MEIAQVYVALPAIAAEPLRRLAGWERIPLAPSESKTISMTVDPLFLSIFNIQKDDWEIVPGEYTFFAGPSSRNLPLKASARY